LGLRGKFERKKFARGKLKGKRKRESESFLADAFAEA
jgi:hypothetical protein